MQLHFEHNDMGLEGEIATDESRPRATQNVQRITVSLGGVASTPNLSPNGHVNTNTNTNINANTGTDTNQSMADVSDTTAPQSIDDVFIPANINRNAPCPCGSGLKYKQCHGKI